MPDLSLSLSALNPRRNRRLVGLLAGLVAAAVLVLPASQAFAQEAPEGGDAGKTPKKQDDGRYLRIVKQQYLAPGGKQQLRLTFDLSPDVPTGTKMEMKLQYNYLTVEETIFEVKGEKRKGVIFDWKLKKKHGPDTSYLLFTAIWPENKNQSKLSQTPEVRNALNKKAKLFPPSRKPWAYTYETPSEKIRIGTEKELAELEQQVCDIYDGFIAQLSESYADFDEIVEKVREGSKYVKEDAFDVKGYTKWYKEWMLDQAAIQEKILLLGRDHPTILNRSHEAHRELMTLGRMVSRHAKKAEAEFEKKYEITIDAKRDRKQKKEDVLQWFDANWRRATSLEALEKTVNKIYDLVCPPEEGAEGEEGAEEGAAKGEAEAGAKKANAKSGQ